MPQGKIGTIRNNEQIIKEATRLGSCFKRRSF
jgi:hypothetical protein